jgi:DNA-binding SARP family transcriptional activator
MDVLNISLFGKFRVTHGENQLPGFEPVKVQELFAYLLLNRARPHPRENLAALLWGDVPTSQSKRYLSKALWQLQTALSLVTAANAPDTDDLLLVDAEWIQLNPTAGYWLDVSVFERAAQLVKDEPGWMLDGERVQRIHEAVQCYRGDLLDGWYQDWCLCERERLQFLYLILLDKLMRFCEAHGEYEAGREFGYRILSLDRAREQTHRQLMRLHYLAGDRTGALRQYQLCKRILKEELDVEPSRRTEDLYEEMRTEKSLPVTGFTNASDFSERMAPDSRMQTLIDRLQRLRVEMESLEQDLRFLARTDPL